jgi:hypothetical protein
MKRIGRIIFTALPMLSLLLCAATAALWVRSYRTGDIIILSHTNGWYFRVNSVGGSIEWAAAPHDPYARNGVRWYRFARNVWLWNPPSTIASDGRKWFDVPNCGENPWIAAVQFNLHYGILCGLLVTAGVAPWAGRARRQWKQRWRADRQLCAVCGYDLRATPDRCPECGTVPKKT